MMLSTLAPRLKGLSFEVELTRCTRLSISVVSASRAADAVATCLRKDADVRHRQQGFCRRTPHLSIVVEPSNPSGMDSRRGRCLAHLRSAIAPPCRFCHLKLQLLPVDSNDKNSKNDNERRAYRRSPAEVLLESISCLRRQLCEERSSKGCTHLTIAHYLLSAYLCHAKDSRNIFVCYSCSVPH